MLSLINKAKWLLGGNILFAFSQWSMLIFFGHFSSPVQLGYYSYALAVTAPIFMLFNLQLRPLMVADLNHKNKFRFSQYFLLRLITTSLAIGACLFFIEWSNSFAVAVVSLVVFIKASESLSDIIYAYYNARKETTFISKSLTIKSFLVILLSFIILYTTKNIIYSLIVTLIGYVVVLVFLDFKKIKEYLKPLNFFDKNLKEIIVTGMPLGITVMLISLQTNIPRYFLEHYLNIELVGAFTIFYYFLIVGGIIINSVCQYLSPYFSEFYKLSKMEDLKRVIIQAALIAFTLGLVGLIVSLPLHQFIIKIIYGIDYVQYSYLLPYMMIAGVFTYLSVVTGYLMTSLELLKIQIPIFLSLVFLTLLYSYLLIPSYGLLGAVYTTILAAFSQFIISSFIVYKKIKGLIPNV